MKFSIIQLAAILLALLIPAGSARTVSRRHQDDSGAFARPEYPASHRPAAGIPSECPSIGSIDVKRWNIQSPQTPGTRIVGLSELYHRGFGMGVDAELACTRVGIRWVGRTKVGGGDTCAYLVDLKRENGSTCETFIAKTPAHKFQEAYEEIRETDERLAWLGLFSITLRDGDGRRWSLDETISETPGATYGTAEMFLRQLGRERCYASIADVRREVLLAARDIFEYASVVLSDDTLQPANLVYHEKNRHEKVQYLDLSVHGDSDSTTTTAQVTAILERSIAAAFSDSLCDQFQMANYEASQARTNRSYRLSHVQ